MQYFTDFEKVNYIFGNPFDLGSDKVITQLFQNISVYSDVIDRVSDNVGFFTFYPVGDGNRPDQTSYDIYGTTIYHWTFFLMNESLRKQGWPLSNRQVETIVKRDFPHVTYTTRDVLTSTHKVGETVVGAQSATSGIVLRRNLDIGQVTVLTENNAVFQTGESITNVSDAITTQTVTCVGSSLEYLSARHYVDGDNERVDIDPAVGPGAQITEKTHFDEYMRSNDNLRLIKVIKPEFINDVVSLFKQAVRA